MFFMMLAIGQVKLGPLSLPPLKVDLGLGLHQISPATLQRLHAVSIQEHLRFESSMGVEQVIGDAGQLIKSPLHSIPLNLEPPPLFAKNHDMRRQNDDQNEQDY
jgi:hypothetical protein